jgi:hypothetical protein
MLTKKQLNKQLKRTVKALEGAQGSLGVLLSLIKGVQRDGWPK